MSNIFENIQFNSSIPIRIFLQNLNYTQNHWHDALEILFVLNGTIQIGIENNIYQLNKEDLIVINPNELHTTSAPNANSVLVLQISSDWLQNYSVLKNKRILCNTRIEGRNHHLNHVRKLLARMMWVYNNQSQFFELEIQSYLFELLYQLYAYFKDSSISNSFSDNEKFMPRLSNIIHYLNENCDKDISLSDLAEKEFLSVSYISRFFKKYIGITYQEYVMRIRLERAVKDLLFTEKSINQLSYDNGFPNTNSFLKVFKDSYGLAPSQYRKESKANFHFLYGSNTQSANVTNNYFELTNFDLFTSLYKYLTWNSHEEYVNDIVHSNDQRSIRVNVKDAKSKLTQSWRQVIAIGKAFDVLNPIIQAQLSTVQSEIGFRAIRFHGIFDDEMGVYKEDSTGQPILDFSTIDRIFDFLISINLKPFIELGFMPELLAQKMNTVFSCRKSFISMPADIDKWCDLNTGFIKHCIERYGLEEVESWHFEFWNEPNMFMFWVDSEDDYYMLYESTYKAIKKISSKLKIGGPAICNLEGMEDWIDRYLTFCKNANCLPDFFSFHVYMHNPHPIELFHSFNSGLKRISLSEDPDFLVKTTALISKIASSNNYDTSNIFLTEWNASPSHRDLSHDTLFMAAYISKNILENMELVQCLAFWTLSDYIEEFPIPTECFHGGLGLITTYGIKKAGYHAYAFLNLLGSEKITSGPGYFITANEKGYQVFIYNYCHYDPLYCAMDHSGISYLDRYNIYKDNVNLSMQIELDGLKESAYKIIERTVSRSFGSSFDTWVDMGAPENMIEEHIEYLKSHSEPQYREQLVNINETYKLQCTLSPHEIKLFEIIRI